MTVLELHGCKQVSDAGLAHFKEYKNMTNLLLQNTAVTEAALVALAKTLPRCKIEWDGGEIEPTVILDPDRKAAEYVLSIGGKATVNGGEIKAATDLPKERFTLTQVNLKDNKALTDAGLAAFKGCHGLTVLDLSSTPVKGPGLENFKDCKALTTLGLNSIPATDVDLANFKDCKALTVLALHSTKVTDAGLAHFKDCKAFTHLDLSATAVTDTGVSHFKDCKNLMSLYLGATAVTDTGLAPFKGCKNLTYIQVANSKVTAKGLEEFHAAVPGCKIEHDGGVIEAIDVDRKAAEYVLSVGGFVTVKSSQIKAVADLPKDRFVLQGVFLGSNKALTDAGLAAFKGCRGLSEFDLSSTPVTDVGVAHFKDCKRLVSLSLGSTKVTDATFANFKDCMELTYLNLSGTTVTDEGVAHFKDCKRLTTINFWNTSVTDAGLANFKVCKNLRFLYVQKTKITAKGIEEFHTTVPGCKIEHDGGTIEPKK